MSDKPIALPPQNVAPEERARIFLEQAAHFQLGHLPTESRHPRTTRLSQLANDNLVEAISLLKDVELEALKTLTVRRSQIEEMATTIQTTFKNGGRVFLCGCGATGRLSLSLETIWREYCAKNDQTQHSSKVISFMAGGDYALVRSIENFEDHPEYGARQLRDLGFTEKDLLIGTSEGGETPWVIGAVEEAARISRFSPYFLYCNPSELLIQTVERSRLVIENPRVKAFALETGPMAVSGSTRLQATTCLMLAVGAALFSAIEQHVQPHQYIEDFLGALNSADLTGLAPLIEAEAAIYLKNHYCLHVTSNYGITVLTDTTERSPTFSLLPFEGSHDPASHLSWTYLVHREAHKAVDSWEKLLGRAPRALPWPGFSEKYGTHSLYQFDFSPTSIERRRNLAGAERFNIFDIDASGRDITLHLNGLETRLKRPTHILIEHLLLKCAMNISSTLAMGRLGRIGGNLMLYVRAANNKLVDRAIRYIRILLDDEGIRDYSYDEICLELFQTVAVIRHDEPAVWRTFERLRDGARPSSSNTKASSSKKAQGIGSKQNQSKADGAGATGPARQISS